MYLYKRVLSGIFFILSLNLYGEETDSALIVFSFQEYDFGQIYEADGNLLVTYQFENRGCEPLVINRIIAPGLSIEKYQRDSIFPGEKAEILLLLNPFNRSGYYHKKIEVFSNAFNSPSELILKGKILSGSYSTNFKFNIGPLAFRQSQVNFGYLYSESEATRFIPVINKSDRTIKVVFDSVPDHLSVKPMFESLKGHEEGTIEVKYISEKFDDWDFVIDRIKVSVLNGNTTKGVLTVSANIREDFSLLTDDEKLNKPIAYFKSKTHNFDTIKGGEKVYYDFILNNKGIRDLNIRSVKPTCGCTAVVPEKKIIPPGDSTFIRVYFDSKGYKGFSKKGVTIITDDPVNYKQFLWITGYIEPE